MWLVLLVASISGMFASRSMPDRAILFHQVRSIWFPHNFTLVGCIVLGAALGACVDTLSFATMLVVSWLSTWTALVVLRIGEERLLDMDVDTRADRSAIALRMLSLPSPTLLCSWSLLIRYANYT